MEYHSIIPGMKVKINASCIETENSFTLCEDMYRYMGSIQTVNRLGRYNAVIINEFSWHPKDLTPVELPTFIERKPELFNPENIF